MEDRPQRTAFGISDSRCFQSKAGWSEFCRHEPQPLQCFWFLTSLLGQIEYLREDEVDFDEDEDDIEDIGDPGDGETDEEGSSSEDDSDDDDESDEEQPVRRKSKRSQGEDSHCNLPCFFGLTLLGPRAKVLNCLARGSQADGCQTGDFSFNLVCQMRLGRA